MPHRAEILIGLPRQVALALAITGMLAGAAPAAVQQSTQPQPTPRELWRAYPLQDGRAPDVRLPAGSSEARPAPRVPAATRSGGDGGAALPIVIGVGLAALLCGLLLGRRRRVAAAGAGAPSPAPTPRPEPEPLHVVPEPVPEPPPVAPAPEPPPIAAEAPAPAPAPPVEPAPVLIPPPAPTALDLEVERLRTGRFERRPWPAETEGGWRCEIAWHAGTLSSGFRAMASAPGRRRPREVGRSEPQRLWGAAPPEPPTVELVSAADRLAAALLDAGWERVEGGGDAWYANRFAWPHAAAPPRVRVRSAPRQEIPHGA